MFLKGRFDVKLPKSFKLESTHFPNVDFPSGPRSLKKQELQDDVNDNNVCLGSTNNFFFNFQF